MRFRFFSKIDMQLVELDDNSITMQKNGVQIKNLRMKPNKRRPSSKICGLDKPGPKIVPTRLIWRPYNIIHYMASETFCM